VLEEAKARGLPVQMLVNKADRLPPAALDEVLALVNGAIAEVRLASLAPPIALSARLALAGKLGDDKALAASGWSKVQALLDETIIARSAELKERALRRRCAKIVASLGVTVARAAEVEDTTRQDADKARHALAVEAARLDADGAAIATKIAGDLPRDALAKDLALVFTGRDEARVATDEVLRRYRVERAVFHLAGPLASAIARELTSLSGGGASSWRTIARASVRAAALATATIDDLAPAASRAALSSVVEELGARAVASPPPAAARGLAAELEELLGLLS
jgi:hypothetical protein